MPDSPDTYDHRPSASELLHDLGRITQAPGGGIVLGPGSTPLGPAQRVLTAVELYKASPEWTGGVTDNDMYLYMREEHDMWRNVVDTLRKLGIEINDQDMLAQTIHLWGELVARLRYNQGEGTSEQVMKRRREEYDMQWRRQQISGMSDPGVPGSEEEQIFNERKAEREKPSVEPDEMELT